MPVANPPFSKCATNGTSEASISDGSVNRRDGGGNSAAVNSAFLSGSMPSPREATVGMIGTPISWINAGTSISIP